ncbi:MAG: carbon-nitrogen hydrolase family protein [bacterium]
MQSFRVAAIALNPVMGEVQVNLSKMLHWITAALDAGARLIVFPEGFLSGYCLDKIGVSALDANAPAVLALQKVAAAHAVWISYGLFERAAAGVYVSQFYAGPCGTLTYRKCHLTAAEKRCCLAGDELSIQDLGFVKVGTQICYDSAFPRASETLVRRGAELLVSPTGHTCDWKAGEPGSRDELIQKRRRHVQKYWRARAYDYSCYGIYVDNAGETMGGEWFPGYVGVFGPDGETVAENSSGEEAMVIADLDGERLKHARAEWVGHYQALADARPELYD